MNTTEFLSKFKNVRENGTFQWMASCPCKSHGKGLGDNNPSLSISWDAHKHLIHCFAGCETEDILKEIGLSMSDLTTRHPVKKYSYTDNGITIHSTIRWEPKEFTQEPVGKHKWILYNLDAVKLATMVFLCEGEKDADSLNKEGACATTTALGASNLSRTDITPLYGKTVVLCPDSDEAGSKYMTAAINALRDHCTLASVSFKPWKDVTEWMEHNSDIKTYISENAEPLNKYAGTLLEKMESIQYMLDTYKELDKPVFEGLMRVNEVSLLAASPKTGKTIFQLNKAICCACAQPFIGYECITPMDTLYIDNELSKPLITMHVREILKVTGWKFVKKFDVLSLRDEPSDYIRICHDVSYLNNRYVVLDAVYKTLSAGMDENSNADLTRVCAAFMAAASKSSLTFDGVHHAAKGNVAERPLVDRAAGAGAISRSVDQMWTLTVHTGPNAKVEDYLYDFEGVSRSFKCVEPQVLRFSYPRWFETAYTSKAVKISDNELAKILVGWTTVKQATVLLNVDRSAAQKRLKLMVEDGLLESKVEEGTTRNVYKRVI